MASRLAELIRTGQYTELSDEVEKEFGVRIDTFDLANLCLHGGSGWRCDARIWLLARLDELGMLFRPTITDEENELKRVNLPVKLHVGWVSVHETPDHVYRRHNAHLEYLARKDEEAQRRNDNPARSKVFSTPRVVQPINRVAARVAPEVEPPSPEELRKLALKKPRAVATVQQIVQASDGSESGTVIGIRRCGRKGCKGVVLLTQWPDGEETRPCTAGMVFDGVKTWRILTEEEEAARIKETE